MFPVNKADLAQHRLSVWIQGISGLKVVLYVQLEILQQQQKLLLSAAYHPLYVITITMSSEISNST